MAVPAERGFTERCSRDTPRTFAPSGRGSETQTPALARFTDGSQTVGGTLVRASIVFETNAVPPFAVVSTPEMIVQERSVWGPSESSPDRCQRFGPMFSRLRRLLISAQVCVVSTVDECRGRWITG